MALIQVITGVRFTPEMFLRRMEKSRRLQKQKVTCRYVNTLYSLCWVFQFRVRMQASKKTVRYAGYYAGFDESVLSPGKILMLPSGEEQEIADLYVLPDKMTEEKALQEAWNYNKKGIIRKFRNLYAPPELEDYVAERMYKPMYIFEFYNLEKNEKKYKVLDSLTGDLDDIELT